MLGAKDTPSLELGFAVALPSKTLEIAREKEWSDRIGGASLISQASCRICNLPLVLLAQLATFVGSSDRLLEIMVCSSFLPSNAQRTSCSSESQGWLIRRTKRSSVPLPIVNVNLPTAKPKPIAKPATPSMPATPTWGSSASSFSQNFSLGGSSSVKPSFNDLLKKRNAAYNKSLPIAPPIASRSPAELKSQEDKEDSFSTSLQKLTLSNTTKCRLALKTWSVEFYPSTRQHKKKDKKKTPTEEEGTSTPGLDSEWKEESYEKMSIPGVTKFFKTFQKEVQEEPEQSIRYQWMGQPLFYGNDQVSMELLTKGPPKCTHCGSHRVFECQLMPYVHQLLQSDPLMQNRESEVKAKDKESILESLTMGMDWGTVLVYSCEKDCDDGTGLFTSTEYAAVQLELN